MKEERSVGWSLDEREGGMGDPVGRERAKVDCFEGRMGEDRRKDGGMRMGVPRLIIASERGRWIGICHDVGVLESLDVEGEVLKGGKSLKDVDQVRSLNPSVLLRGNWSILC